MLFGVATESMKIMKQSNQGMRLPGWKDDVIIRIQYPDEHSKMGYC